VLTNCSNNYGPWQFPEKLIPVVIPKAVAGEPIPLINRSRRQVIVSETAFAGKPFQKGAVDALLTLSSKGHLVILARLRQLLGLQAGDRLALSLAAALIDASSAFSMSARSASLKFFTDWICCRMVVVAPVG
jgi:hypothetical protein